MSDDPFDVPEKRPAVSWKDAQVGHTIVGTVIEAPREVHSRDFETGELAYWDKEQQQPKMSVVIGLKIDGEDFTLWCPRPSSMFYAVAEAQKAAGERIQLGGILKVRLKGRKPNEKNPRLNPQNIFQAKYEPPDAFAESKVPETSGEPGDAPAQEEMIPDDTPF